MVFGLILIKIDFYLGYTKNRVTVISTLLISSSRERDAVHQNIKITIKNSNGKEIFYKSKNRLGKSPRFLGKDKEGNVLYYLAQIVDITDRRE
jgi:hypothetical protein